MKKSLLLSTFSILALCLSACQGTESTLIPWATSTPKTIKIYLNNAAVKVEGYNGNKVIIATVGSYTPEHDERAEGLSVLSSLGTDNTGKGIFMKQEHQEIILHKVTRHQVDYRIKVPKNAQVILEETSWQGHQQYEMAHLNGDVEVRTKNADMYFTQVHGTIKARSTSGDAYLLFDQFKPGNSHDISLVSGSIDVTLPSNAQTDLVMKTTSGEIFTDFEFPQNHTTSASFDADDAGAKVRRSLNGGGSTTRLSTVSSNIYLRKKK